MGKYDVSVVERKRERAFTTSNANIVSLLYSVCVFLFDLLELKETFTWELCFFIKFTHGWRQWKKENEVKNINALYKMETKRRSNESKEKRTTVIFERDRLFFVCFSSYCLLQVNLNTEWVIFGDFHFQSRWICNFFSTISIEFLFWFCFDFVNFHIFSCLICMSSFYLRVTFVSCLGFVKVGCIVCWRSQNGK